MRDPADELAQLEAQQLRRHLRVLESAQGPVVTIDGREYLNFSSNDYLGLASHPSLKAALIEAVEKYGAGSGASRLICGTLGPHAELEEKLADFKRTEAAVTFSTGYATAVGTITALCQKDDILILDKLCHASLIDGARLSGATMRVFPHNDLDKLASHLAWADSKIDRDSGRVLVITESVFSMDGDRAPLKDIVELKEKHGALLLVDEAHAFGIIGPQGRGLGAELKIDDRIDLQMGTLSKAVGLSGGYVCASRALIDLMINRARSFIYSTAPPPAVATAAIHAVELIASDEGDDLREQLSLQSWRFSTESAIVPVILGSNEVALQAADEMKTKGYLIPAIRYPTVPRDQARLRITLSAAHSDENINGLLKAIVNLSR